MKLAVAACREAVSKLLLTLVPSTCHPIPMATIETLQHRFSVTSRRQGQASAPSSACSASGWSPGPRREIRVKRGCVLFLCPVVKLGGIPVLAQHTLPSLSLGRISTMPCPVLPCGSHSSQGREELMDKECCQMVTSAIRCFMSSLSSWVWYGFSPWQEFHLLNPLSQSAFASPVFICEL